MQVEKVCPTLSRTEWFTAKYVTTLMLSHTRANNNTAIYRPLASMHGGQYVHLNKDSYRKPYQNWNSYFDPVHTANV